MNRLALAATVLATATALAACREQSSTDGKGAPASRTARPASHVAQSDRVPSSVHFDRVFVEGVTTFSGTAAIPATDPFAGDSESIRFGEKLFSGYNCDGCHGGGAVGWVGPSLTDGRWRYGVTDAEVFRSIYYGQPHGMPSYGGVLQPVIIWKIVAYLKSLPPPKDVPTERW